MLDKQVHCWFGFLVLLLLCGCAGTRSGLMSYPYVGSPPPLSTIDSRNATEVLAFPGVKVKVTLNNAVQTLDTQVMLFVVPTSIDLRDRTLGNQSTGLRAYLGITPESGDFILKPGKAVVRVNGRPYPVILVRHISAYDSDYKNIEGEIEKSESAPEQRRYELQRPGRFYLFSLAFDVATPDPKQVIELDLSEALVSPARAPLPPIQFVPAYWEESYS